ncbi:hypothetical protein VNI00_000468 [Paramarasmius palmivorus]|uniref:Uncharacterized protein n=1 Tax=Paramarasmius palmivorus TaxID=297713 RepID=A0AAW0E5T0_9AGAR
MSSTPSTQSPAENNRLVAADNVIEIMERYLQRQGARGMVVFLLLNKTVTQGVLRHFYRNIQLSSRRSFSALCRTLVMYPPRVRFIRSLWLVFEEIGPLIPVFPTHCYPEGFLPAFPRKRPLDRGEVEGTAHLVTISSHFLVSLTIGTARYTAELAALLRNIHFPRLAELEVPALLFFTWLPSQLPSLRRLRVSTDMNDLRGAVSVLYTPDFRGFVTLSHLYIAFGNVWGQENAIQVALFEIRTTDTVRAVAIEYDEGEATPFETADILNYGVHPKVVVVMDERWVDGEVDRLIAPSLNPNVREERLRNLILTQSRETASCVWDAIDEKVEERWTFFEGHYNSNRKAEILDGPEMFVL